MFKLEELDGVRYEVMVWCGKFGESSSRLATFDCNHILSLYKV